MPYHNPASDKPYGDDLQHTITLTSSSGRLIDITKLVLEFTIYESIFRTSMSADFVIRDAIGLIDDLPLLGQELVTVTFTGRAARKGPRKNIVFKTYKIADRQKIAGDAHIYTLSAASIELERNLTSNISPVIKNKTGSEAVRQIFDDHIKNESNKEIYIEEVENIVSYTGTRKRPYDVIKYIGENSRSVDYGDSSYFLFYETRQGYNFRTLASLFNQERSQPIYYFSDPSTESTVNDVQARRHSVIGFTFLDTVDTLSLLKEGYFDNHMIAIDPLTKSYQESEFNYARDFESIPHIDKGGMPTIDTAATKLLGSEMQGPSHKRLIVDNLSISQTNNQSFDERIDPDNDFHTYHVTERFRTAQSCVVQRASLKQHGVNITVPSNLDIIAGDIIVIKIPTNKETGNYIKHYGDQATFLVTSVSNRMTKNGDYITSMECVKESFGSDMRGNPIYDVLEEVWKGVPYKLPLTFQDFNSLPFPTDKITSIIVSSVNSVKNKIIQKAKDTATEAAKDAVEKATTDAVEQAATDAVEETTETVADIATKEIQNVEDSINSAVEEFNSEEFKANLKDAAITTATGLAVTQLVRATGLTPAQFAKIVAIVKLAKKLPLFKAPSEAAEAAAPSEAAGGE